MTTARRIDPSSTTDDLIVELQRHAVSEGANTMGWPGLTIYRFTQPAGLPPKPQAGTLAIGIVTQGGSATVVSGPRLNLHRQIAHSAPHRPCLCMVLQVDPRLIRRVWLAMAAHHPRLAPAVDDFDCTASQLDVDLLDSTVRFLRSLTSESDRRVLAPLYLEEAVYRVLQGEQCARLVGVALHRERGPVAETLEFIDDNLHEPLTVAGLARRVHLSSSSLSRVFREATGRSPYQYVKEARLTRARELLAGGHLGIAGVAYLVGYTSISHFIKEFRNRFGMTPGDYADTVTAQGRRSRTSIA